MTRLQDKIVVITGAAGGMGAAAAQLFAEEGAHVVATDLQEEKLYAWVNIARAGGLKVHAYVHDVTLEDDWEKLMQWVITLFGRIDVLVNNAGIYPGMFDIAETDTALWLKVHAINLTGPFLGMKAVIPLMRDGGGGSIVNIASIAGLVGGNGAAYSSSKGGLLALTRDVAVLHAKDHIRVNAICPGGVRTPMTEAMLQSPGMEEQIRHMSPQDRIADAMEIAQAALFLASDAASFMTGSHMVVDGGAVAR
jgi:NAD(P)-dependent dehydrogenase (short-subunit alcohol dehydrogenase family)